ncbi:MAG: SCP2 sterol-binding domain-containing protein [Actinomycetota bacterium]|nr:SCP2 sterol-binding domain-containing protein [Actinomycetota bacterium]
MARFLSADWLEQASGAVTAASGDVRLPHDVSLAVRQVVRGGPEGDVAYTVRFGNGGIEFTAGGEGDADVVVTSPYETAVSISKGDLSPAVALASGALRVSGKVGLLAEHREAWAALGDLLAPVRASTEY